MRSMIWKERLCRIHTHSAKRVTHTPVSTALVHQQSASHFQQVHSLFSHGKSSSTPLQKPKPNTFPFRIAEKFDTWTDETPPLDDILDSVTLYWHTQSFARCIFPYRHLDTVRHDAKELHIHAPKVFGFSLFPADLGPVPKAWAETTGNMVWYKQHTSGGHFASMEKPVELWEDVEDFVGKVWNSVAKL